MDKFSSRICEVRTKKGVTQYKLAQDLSVNRSSVSKWESGDRMPSFEMMLKIAAYFDVSTDYLYGISDEPSIQIMADPEDAEFLADMQGRLKNYEALPERIQGLNALLEECGYIIRRLEGETEYSVFTRNGVFIVSEDKMNALASASGEEIKKKIDYLEMENKIKLLENLNKKE